MRQQYAKLRVFADELKTQKKEKKLQPKLARQLTANNPKAFEKDVSEKKDKCWYTKKGESLKGHQLKNRSKSLLKTQHKLPDIARKLVMSPLKKETLHNPIKN